MESVIDNDTKNNNKSAISTVNAEDGNVEKQQFNKDSDSANKTPFKFHRLSNLPNSRTHLTQEVNAY